MRIVFLFLFWSSAVAAQRSSDRRVNAFLDAQERLVQDVAKRATELHSQREQLLQSCTCSGDICGRLDGPQTVNVGEGTRVGVTVPPGTNVSSLSASLKESICLYQNADGLVAENRESRDGAVYIGTHDGHARVYTGQENSSLSSNGCEEYDPRAEPWYRAAERPPLDVVLLVDRSWFDRQQKDVADELLDTLTLADFVNVVAFTESATALWNESSLVRATRLNVAALKERLSNTDTSIRRDYKNAFRVAFELLSSCREGADSCSGCRKVIFFVSSGRVSSFSGVIDPVQVLSTVAELQTELETATSQRASIFSLTVITDFSSLAGLISCANEGVYIDTDARHPFAPYGRSIRAALSSAERLESPVWTEPDAVAEQLNAIATVSMPFYSADDRSSVVPLGVVAHDITGRDAQTLGISRRELLSAIEARFSRCLGSTKTDCEMQVIRDAYTGVHCADPFPIADYPELEDVPWGCYKHRGSFYKRFPDPVDWETAAFSCVEDGGELISVYNITIYPADGRYDSDREERAVLGFPDRGEVRTSWPYRSKQAFLLEMEKRFEHYWVGICRAGNDYEAWISLDYIASFPEGQTGAYNRTQLLNTTCHSMRRRDPRYGVLDGGLGGALFFPSSEDHPYICEYRTREDCESGIESFIPPETQFDVPRPSQCPERILGIEETRPLEVSETLSQEQVLCSYLPVSGATRLSISLALLIPVVLSCAFLLFEIV